MSDNFNEWPNSVNGTIQDELESENEFKLESPEERQPRSRRSFSYRQKLEILARYDQIGTLRGTALKTGVSRKQIRAWLNMRAILVTEPERSRVKGAGKKIDPRLEYRLLSFVRRAMEGKNEGGEKLSYGSVRDKALYFAQQLDIKGFRASNGFIQRFLQRNNIDLRKKHTSLES